MAIRDVGEKLAKSVRHPSKAAHRIREGARSLRWGLAGGRGGLSASVYGLTIHLNPSDHGVSKSLYLDGVFEPAEKALYRELVKDDWIVADVGANIGYFALQFGQWASNGTVYAFEPDASNCALLRQNLGENSISNVVCKQAAVSAQPGEANLYKHPTNAGGHSLHKKGVLPFADFPVDGEVETVDCVSFDQYFSHSDRSIPDFVKIDVEGGEPDVIHSMEESLDSEPIIAFEFTPHMWSEAPENVFDLLSSFGYSFYEIVGGGDVAPRTSGELVEYGSGWYDILCSTDDTVRQTQ